MKTKPILPLVKSDPWLEPYADAIQADTITISRWKRN